MLMSLWYREEDWYDPCFAATWKSLLQRFSGGAPILIVDNGGPIRCPYSGVEIIENHDLREGGKTVVGAQWSAERRRGTSEHYYNCAAACSLGMKTLAGRGVERAVFIGQNFFVGAPFLKECMAKLEDADLLFNLGCLFPQGAHTEYFAANPVTTTAVGFWDKKLEEGQLYELQFPLWAEQCGLRSLGFPVLSKVRDRPLQDDDTCWFHGSKAEMGQFLRRIGAL